MSFEDFLLKVKAANYHGEELGFPFDKVIRNEMVSEIRDHDLEFIAQHYEISYANIAVHKENYRGRLENLGLTQPKFINSQTGKDFFRQSKT